LEGTGDYKVLFLFSCYFIVVTKHKLYIALIFELFMVGIAKGYDLLAMDLGEYVARYIPGNWIVDIRNVYPIPYFQVSEAKELFELHKEGDLSDKLKEKGGRLEPWFIQEAVNSFFENGEYARSEPDFD